MKKIFIFFLFLICFLVNVNQVSAITETDGDLQVTYDEPLFPASVIWYPGLSVTKSMTVKNIGSSKHTVYLKASNTSQSGNIDDLYLFNIYNGATDLYGGSGDKTMRDFWQAGQLNLTDIDGGNATSYSQTISMPVSAGNEYQNKFAKFDLIVGFVGTTSTVIVSGGGGDTGAKVCTDTKPGSAPVLLSAVAGVNSTTLHWTEASDPVSYYLVAYGISPANNTYGNPNIGPKGTTGYTVNNLSGGVTYCFIVRAGNGCSPGPFSSQICTTPFGAAIGGIATEFAPGVLGETTPSAKIIKKPGEIKGIETVEVCKNCYWWPILLGQAIALYFFRRRYPTNNRKKYLSGALISVFAYLIFIWISRNCTLQGFFCRYFILFDALEYLIYLYR